MKDKSFCPKGHHQKETCRIDMEIDAEGRLSAFQFTKVSCGRVPTRTEYSAYCAGRSLSGILKIPFLKAAEDLKADSEEKRFFLYLEWDALRSAIAQYTGIDDENIDATRCLIASIEHLPNRTLISQIILPPQDLPIFKDTNS